MAIGAGYLAGAKGILQRDLVVYLSYRGRFLAQMVQVVFSLTLFYYISQLLGAGTRFGTPQEYFAFAVLGLAIVQMLTAALVSLPGALRQELVAGTFERLVLSPCGAVVAIISMSIFPIASALATGALTLVLAAAFFGLELDGARALLGIPVAVAGAIAFMPFALLFSAMTLAIRQAVAGTAAVVTLLSLVGGFFFPVDLLPSWIRWASDVQPFTPALELLRHVLVGTPLTESGWLLAGKLVGFTVVLLPISVIAVSAALRHSQQKGTVIEY
jgi:ABC-2 type transport system permease protein